MRSVDLTKILFVEDSEEDFLTVKRAFKQAGVKNSIYRVKTGDEALDYLFNKGKYESEDDYPKPALILLDLNLPGLSGRDVLQALKKDSSLKKIPVIILTTSNDEKDVDACYRDGANSYMQKPVEFQGFVEAISRLQDYWFEISILPKEL